jgi:predicted secreted hydrolase
MALVAVMGIRSVTTVMGEMRPRGWARWLGWLVLPAALLVLAGLAYALWPRQPMPAEAGFDAAAVAAALVELDDRLEAETSMQQASDTEASDPQALDAETETETETQAQAQTQIQTQIQTQTQTETEAGFGPLSFPEDHAAHPQARAELWELTALLRDVDERPVAIRLSLARLSMRAPQSQRSSALAADDLFAGELEVMAATEIQPEPFLAQRASRAALGLAGAEADGEGAQRVWLEHWSLRRRPDGSLQLRAAADGVDWLLDLSPMKAPVALDRSAVDGEPPQGGADALRGYSQSRLAVSGWRRVDGVEHRLKGLGWLDHGWGAVSDALAGGRGQLVANRFQLQLDDGADLSCLHLRRRGGGGTPIPNCLLIGNDGEQRVLQRRELSLEPMDADWVSQGGMRYPLSWRLAIPAQDLELMIQPLFAEQVLRMSETSATTLPGAEQRWRGAVSVQGRRGADGLSGQGRMDLNGYDAETKVGG